jgi:hypothetical protein
MNLFSMGGRKFLLTLVSGAGTFLLVLLGKIDGAVYAAVTIGPVGAYIAGNVVETRGGAQQRAVDSATIEGDARGQQG